MSEYELNIINSNLETLSKIDLNVMKTILVVKYDVDYSENKTYLEMGLDELNGVELMMDLEKELDIMIPDDLGSIIFHYDRNPKFISEISRNFKLNKLI